MGIDLVKCLVTLHAHDLNAAELLVMTCMCSTALDRPNDKGNPERLYTAGWKPLASAMGCRDLKDDDEIPPAIQTRIKRALKGLRDKGHISSLNVARWGTRQTYRIEIGLQSRGSPDDHQ